ncbi:MAG TPA: PAP/fibrillin family protein [Leptolyngbyaceae cyanobacterium]
MLGKAELIEAIAPTNRGLLASDSDRKVIQAAASRLEGRNPTPSPLTATDLLAGNWRLLYTTSQELLGIDRVPLARLGQIYQCIRVADQRIFNIAEVESPLPLSGIVCVSARFQPVSNQRVNVAFERGVLGLRDWLGYRSPSQLIEKLETTEKLSLFEGIDFRINSDRQQGWLEVTYLDQDLRIGRGNEGNLFVLKKVAP